MHKKSFVKKRGKIFDFFKLSAYDIKIYSIIKEFSE